MKRWIQQGDGQTRSGKGEPPPTGDVHFVDETGSMALVGGRLYINGQPAPVGEHEITLPDLPPDQVLAITVDAEGKATKKIKTKIKAAGKPKGGV